MKLTLTRLTGGLEARAEPRFFPQWSPDGRTADSRWKGKLYSRCWFMSAPRMNPLFGTQRSPLQQQFIELMGPFRAHLID